MTNFDPDDWPPEDGDRDAAPADDGPGAAPADDGPGAAPAGDWEDDELEYGVTARWPLTWRSLYPRERYLWFERLWHDVCHLGDRYRLSVRSGWWEDEIQLEALAALAAWTERYDSGEWDDPPGKLALLFDLERVSPLLRDGLDPFRPGRDRPAFEAYLISIGCLPPPTAGPRQWPDGTDR
jgi:hypothetical protein